MLRCALLQEATNRRILEDCAPPRIDTKVDGLRCIDACRIGSVGWAVFQGDNARYIIFRGYTIGTRLPYPFRVRRTIMGMKHCVNFQPWNAWKRAERAIQRACVVNDDCALIVSGYSTGCAMAMLTSLHNAVSVSRVCLFSPFAFCDRDLWKRVPHTAAWIQGDCLPTFYACFFAPPPRAHILMPTQFYFYFFGMHDTRVIAQETRHVVERTSSSSSQS